MTKNQSKGKKTVTSIPKSASAMMEADTKPRIFTIADLYETVAIPVSEPTVRISPSKKLIYSNPGGDQQIATAFHQSRKLKFKNNAFTTRTNASGSNSGSKNMVKIYNTMMSKGVWTLTAADMERHIREREEYFQTHGLETEAEANEYYLMTSPILFKYSDQSISDEERLECIREYFEAVGIDALALTPADTAAASSSGSTVVNYSMNSHGYGLTEADYHCRNCDNGRMAMTDGFLVCTTCGFTENGTLDYQITFKDTLEMNNRQAFSYKKSNHFAEWLSSIQGKESCSIPEYVIQGVRDEICKEKCIDLTKLNGTRIRAYLRKLGYNKYYEKYPSILFILTNKPPLKLPPEIEAKMKNMFRQIQEPFEKTKPAIRRNFLSYSYVLHKFCELLGMPETAKHFPLLKSAEKLRSQDCMWRAICEELGWEFIPSQ
ncbi:poxvirus late transcription factor VLTF3 like-domain-containing protein [Polychytrium aggregatum]|uniref:poxvirus late transcription factor VLTF3 like-domain-containing protein n=1 Tax=Polychytrium aggregatum TaxID=110093 RepID=UPI0022FF03A6|nr:poxvirus late transcription factor VLTF3 like-domain-containing protein [Polychytrium aggregatum]KAI9190532.1 poxvirus late transcription factor VLTF3 like-domain-containing protein [Polychytrium aggregatum]